MRFRRHRRHRSKGSDPNRARAFVYVGGLTAVLAIAIGLPIVLSSPAPAPVSTPSTAQANNTLPYVPPLIPVDQLSPPPGGQPSLPPLVRQTNFPKPPPDLTPGPGVTAQRVRVPGLSIDLPIIEGDGIDVPMNMAAHYPGSAWPGGGTNIYLYAHAREGMFLNLWSARVGDRVFMDLTDGTTREYVVEEVMPAVPWDAVELLDPTPTEQVTLQTCVGTSPTAPRFVVIAVPVA